MKKIILVILCFFLIYISYSFFEAFKPNTTIPSLQKYLTRTAKLGTQTYTLYIADSPKLQEQGLSNVKNMPSSAGMLFVFSKPNKYYFWMKDMKFPLDFVFIRNNVVIDTLENIDPNSYPKAFTAISPFDSVLELNNGEILKSNVIIGDTLQGR